MFIISFLPDWLLILFINLIILVGLFGTCSSYFIKLIPMLAPQAKVLKIAGIVMLVIGVYLRGGYSNEMSWRERVAELEAKVAIAEAQSKESNKALESKVKEKTKVVKELQVVIQERIIKEAAKIDAECKVSPEAIEILNKAAAK